MLKKVDESNDIEVYFKIRDLDRTYCDKVGVVSDVSELMGFVKSLLDKYSKVKSNKIECSYKEPYLVVDYGASNAFYLCSNVVEV
mgnify:CR=1 FL=1|jgi:hypothetical protein